MHTCLNTVCWAGLGHAESAPGAASALRQMCEACSGLLDSVAEELLGTYARTQGMGPIEKGTVRNGQLQLQERLVLQVGCSPVLSHARLALEAAMSLPYALVPALCKRLAQVHG